MSNKVKVNRNEEIKFSATVKITIARNVANPITVRELADYLADACVLDIDIEQYGQPDDNNSISEIAIAWDELTEIIP